LEKDEAIKWSWSTLRNQKEREKIQEASSKSSSCDLNPEPLKYEE
jgi:hypothetical protein